jgi:hypothetical protein
MDDKLEKVIRSIDELKRQIAAIQATVTRDSSTDTSTRMLAEDTHRIAVNIEAMSKDMMKGMQTIYSSVDELEENIVPERRTS